MDKEVEKEVKKEVKKEVEKEVEEEEWDTGHPKTFMDTWEYENYAKGSAEFYRAKEEFYNGKYEDSRRAHFYLDEYE